MAKTLLGISISVISIAQLKNNVNYTYYFTVSYAIDSHALLCPSIAEKRAVVLNLLFK